MDTMMSFITIPTLVAMQKIKSMKEVIEYGERGGIEETK